MLASNDNAEPVLFDGPDNIGLYSAIAEAHAHLPGTSTLAMFAPQEELLHVFGEGLVSLKRRDFRKRDKKPYAHRDQIKVVYGLAANRNLELLALKPRSAEEFEKLALVGDFARDRLREALDAAANA
ncbi:hypothetical protein AB9E07_00285 [Rhizobium leguminosarum]